MPRLLICRSCFSSREDEQDSKFQHHIETALEAAGLSRPFDVEMTDCMGACETPVTVALQGKGMASYVFSGLRGTEDVPDLVETCRLYAESPQGWIDDARRCGRLRYLLRARLPSLT